MNVGGGATIDGLTISQPYTKTLTLNTSLTIKDNGDRQSTGLLVSGGASNTPLIAQPNGSASAINLYGQMNWTYGAIGSQTNGASNLNLYAGSSGTAAVFFGGSSSAQEYLGDNLTINNGVTVTLTGTDNGLVMTNSASINNQMGTLNIQAGGGGGGGITNASGSTGTLTSDTEVFVTGATGTSYVQCIPLFNTGHFWVGDANGTNTKLVIQGSLGEYNVGFYNLGSVELYTGANLDPRSGFAQDSGSISVLGAVGTGYLCYDAPAGGADVAINRGYVGFAESDQTLETGGSFSMTGGNMSIAIDVTAGTMDQVQCYSGNLSIGGGVSILVNTIDIPPQGMPTADWVIFQCLLNGTVSINPSTINWDWVGQAYSFGNNAQQFWLHSTAPGG